MEKNEYFKPFTPLWDTTDFGQLFIDKKTILRIVNWNCHYGLSIKKYNDILFYYPQILVIQECTKNDFDYIKNMWKYKNWYNDDLKITKVI